MVRKLAFGTWAYWRGLSGEYRRDTDDSLVFHRAKVVKLVEDWDFGFAILSQTIDYLHDNSHELDAINARVFSMARALLNGTWFLFGHESDRIEWIDNVEGQLVQLARDLSDISPLFKEELSSMSNSLSVESALVTLQHAVAERKRLSTKDASAVGAEERVCVESRNLFNAFVDRVSFWDVPPEQTRQVEETLRRALESVTVELQKCRPAMERRVSDFDAFKERVRRAESPSTASR